MHEGRHPSEPDEMTVLRNRERVQAETDTEAIVVAMVRTQVARASMATRITSIEVS